MLSDFFLGLLGLFLVLWVGLHALIRYSTIKHGVKNHTEPHAINKETYEQRMKRKAIERKRDLNKLSSHGVLLAVYVGGTNTRMTEGSTVYLSTIDDALVISHAIATHDAKIPIKDILSVEISGPGTQTTNAGLIGGGFGLEGAVKGMLAAALVNAATTKTTTNTFLRVATRNSEALFHFNDREPSALRLTLSHIFVAAEANKAPQVVVTNSISDEIVKLQSLKEAGVLSEEEFVNAKSKLLSNQIPCK